MKDVTRIYIIRHGETDNNKLHRFIGSTDHPLNDRGQAQAASLKAPFSKIHVDRIYASPLKRTMMTAEGVRADRDIPVIKVPGIREIECGQWEGLNRQEIEERWPGQIDLWQFHPAKLHMEGGETLAQVQRRAVEAFLDIVEKERGNSVAVVSHMLTIQLIMCGLLGIDIDEVWRMVQLENTSITSMDFYPDNTFEVVKWGEAGHLPVELTNASVKIAGFTKNEAPKYDVAVVEGKHDIAWKREGAL